MPTTIQNTQVVFNNNTTLSSGGTGMIAYFAANAIPSGWLKANGANVSRTTYATLFSAIGTLYGAGDGVTTFTLPDMRGQFPRGWDDGRGVDSGRAIGSTQGDAIVNITGTLIGNCHGEAKSFIFASGTFTMDTIPSRTAKWEAYPINSFTRAYFAASNQVTTAAEFRPVNFALLACIKF
jgi:microcystin-dependent protein